MIASNCGVVDAMKVLFGRRREQEPRKKSADVAEPPL
jgi:hypothetical protein